jgi:hypothetical protein
MRAKRSCSLCLREKAWMDGLPKKTFESSPDRGGFLSDVFGIAGEYNAEQSAVLWVK